jgi:hypothetical protein
VIRGGGRNQVKTIVLGSGSLAIRIADWFLNSPRFELLGVVRRQEEPEWDEKLSGWALEHGVTCWPGHTSVPGSGFLAFSCFYDKILDRDFIARCGLALNLHASPLPRYRGMRPVNWALKNGEREHGVTIHGIDEGVDSGPIYSQVKFTIWPEFDEVRDVYERCLRYGWPLFTDTMERIESIVPTAQRDEDALTYYGRDAVGLGDRANWTREESAA